MIREALLHLKKNCDRKKRLKKYRGYRIASTGDDMYKYIDWTKAYTNAVIKNVFEIGANYAQDAEVLAEGFDVAPENVYVFEAHPQICDAIRKIHPKYNCFNKAVFNENKQMTFNLCDIDSVNSGVSSLYASKKFQYEKEYPIEAIRMDTFLNNHNIDNIGFCKIDVEGCDYEVLEGFGTLLKNVVVVQVEGEHVECWEGEHLYFDIESILKKNGFELLLFERHLDQSDSLWVNKKYVRTK